jgi:hypothetical protein
VMWLIFTPAPFLISRLALIVGTPISNTAILLATALFAALFLLPAAREWGLRVPYVAWNRAGLTLAIAYLVAAAFAHHVALDRVKRFAAKENLEVSSMGALPMPPSLWHWNGLVRAPRGVYEVRMDLSDGLLKGGSSTDPEVLEHTYYPDAATNEYIEAARRIHEVQEVLWFARFPVTRFHKEGDDAVVEFADMRFPRMRRDREASFTYRVRFNADNQVLSQGWVRR